MFDAGTNSAETPRLGASAPSLNSMGADARYATQPVVRRAVTAESATPSKELSQDQETFLQKQKDKREREEDKVASDNGEFFERIVDALEQRVLDELERRGYRNVPGVY